MLTHFQHRLSLAALVYQHPAQTESSSATLLETLLNQSAGSLKNFGRQFAAVFTGHRAFDAFDNRGPWSAVIFKLLGTIMHRHTRPAADVFVIGALIGILEASPATDIIYKDGGEVDFSVLNILNHLCQRIAPFNVQAAFALVRIYFDDFQTPAFGVFKNNIHLVTRGILLMLRGHPHIRGSAVLQILFVILVHTQRHFVFCTLAGFECST